MIAWLLELIIPSFLRDLWGKFFPSKDEQLGALKENAAQQKRTDEAKDKLDAVPLPDPDKLDNSLQHGKF